MKKIIALLLLLSFPAQAEGLKYIPKWSMCGDRACYTFEQAKQLVQIDADLVLLYAKLDLQQGIILDLRSSNEALSKTVTSLELDVSLLKQQNDKLTIDLKQAVKEKNDAVAQTGGVSFGWVIAGAAICVAGGLAFGIVLSNK